MLYYVYCKYGAVPLQRDQFSPISSPQTHHSSTVMARYGVHFVRQAAGIIHMTYCAYLLIWTAFEMAVVYLWNLWEYFTWILCEGHMKWKRTSSEIHMNVSYQFHRKLMSSFISSYELHIISYELQKDFIWSLYDIQTHFIRNSCAQYFTKFHTNVIWSSYMYEHHMNIILSSYQIKRAS